MDSQNLSSVAYREIKDMLISLRFPPGAPIREQELADLLGMSRTPIREALQRLGHEGWVLLGDKKRITVSEVTRKDIEEIFQLRLQIEPFAAEEILKQGKGRIVAAALDDIVNEIAKASDDTCAFARLNMEFHTTIISAISNEKLSRFWQGLYEEMSRAVVIFLRSNGYASAHNVAAEHAILVDAFWKKDRDRVLKTILLHLDKSKTAILAEQDFAAGLVSNSSSI